jgi:hypothetical protein
VGSRLFSHRSDAHVAETHRTAHWTKEGSGVSNPALGPGAGWSSSPPSSCGSLICPYTVHDIHTALRVRGYLNGTLAAPVVAEPAPLAGRNGHWSTVVFILPQREMHATPCSPSVPGGLGRGGPEKIIFPQLMSHSGIFASLLCPFPGNRHRLLLASCIG